MPERRAGVVFDMDGVLVLTAHLHSRVWQEYVAQAPHEALRSYERRPGRRATDVLAQLLGDVLDQAEREAIVRRLHERFLELHDQGESTVAPGVGTLLRRLSGRVPVGIATSSSIELARTLLGDLLDTVDDVVTGADCGAGKPSPDPYLVAASRLGIEPSWSLAVEDTLVGVESAASAGFRVVGITGTFCAAELLEAGAEVAVSAVPDDGVLLALLSRAAPW